jgi:hypothetical protein
MEKHPGLALTAKYLITAVGIGILVVFKNFVVFGRVRVRSLIYVFFFLYLLLVSYEIYFYYTRIRTDPFLSF